MTVLFVKLDVLKFSDGADSSTKEEHKALHRALCAMQRVLFRFEGTVYHNGHHCRSVLLLLMKCRRIDPPIASR